MSYYPGVFKRICRFPGPPYHIQLDPSVTPKLTPCHPIPVQLKEAFQQEVSKMLQVGVLKPVQEVTPWINSFVLVEGKDKSGNLKLRICLDPTNLNKVIMRESYHFQPQWTLIICLQMHALLLSVIVKRDTGINSLMDLPHFSQPLIQNLADSGIL